MSNTLEFDGTSVKDFALREIASVSAQIAEQFAAGETIETIDADDLLTLRMAAHLARTTGASRLEIAAAMKQEV